MLRFGADLKNRGLLTLSQSLKTDASAAAWRQPGCQQYLTIVRTHLTII